MNDSASVEMQVKHVELKKFDGEPLPENLIETIIMDEDGEVVEIIKED